MSSLSWTKPFLSSFQPRVFIMGSDALVEDLLDVAFLDK